MKIFNDNSLYEEIEPGTGRGWKKKFKLSKYAVTIISVTSVCAILSLFIVFSGGPSLVPTEFLPNKAVPSTLILQQSGEFLDENILVEIDNGVVRGFKMTSRGGREFLAFRGIPYGKPPVGKLRFQPPEEVDSWDDILNATEFGPDCLQRSKRNVKGNEDCLYLNVYTPKKFDDLGKRKRLPVMVYIHGGVAGGSAMRNSGEYLMDEDVVLVGMNYRVGVMGNLNTNDSEARGNQGLRDQVKALEWVKANIKKFGGDKRQVTLFGNSYGAMAISIHLLSPMTEGLFHQVICQSGVAIYPELIQQNPLENSLKLGEKLKCNASTTTELIKCFQNTNARTLILTSYEIKPIIVNELSISKNVFTTSVDPSLDDVVSKDDVYLPQSPLKLLQSGQTKHMPTIIGVNSGEGLFQSVPILSSPNLTKIINERWESIAPAVLHLTSPIKNEIVTSAKDFYFGLQDISEYTWNNLTDLFSDRFQIHPAHVSAFYQKEANRRRENVYLYYFAKNVKNEESYLNSFASVDENERAALGPAHADEIQFLFPYPPFPLIPSGSTNYNFSKMMVRLWVSFATNGKLGLADNNAEWLPIIQKPYDWLQLDEEPKMVKILEERMKFWDSYNLTDFYV